MAGCGSGASGGSGSPFCQKFRDLNAHPGAIFNGLGLAPSLSAGTATTVVIPAFERIDRLLHQLDQEAPATVKPDMDTTMPVFDSLLSALRHTGTYGAAKAYEAAHPPQLDPTRAVAAEQHLTAYVRSTCHVKVSS